MVLISQRHCNLFLLIYFVALFVCFLSSCFSFSVIMPPPWDKSQVPKLKGIASDAYLLLQLDIMHCSTALVMVTAGPRKKTGGKFLCLL